MIDLRHPVTEIESNPAILGGDVIFKGYRLSLLYVGQMHVAGVPLDVIREDYPYLSVVDILAARRFYDSSEVLRDLMLEDGFIDMDKWATR